jgi:hypothetical protein
VLSERFCHLCTCVPVNDTEAPPIISGFVEKPEVRTGNDSIALPVLLRLADRYPLAKALHLD